MTRLFAFFTISSGLLAIAAAATTTDPVSTIYDAAKPPESTTTAAVESASGYPTPLCPTGVVAKPYAPIPAGQYPQQDCTPYVQDPQVQEWLKLVDFSKVPSFAPTNNGDCLLTGGEKPNQCWWTCSTCNAPGDVVSCPQPKTWGLTYDDGPSPQTPQLLDYLDKNNIKSTFFIVGSRVVDSTNAATLKREYQNGHQIAVHTWSHHAMTSLTNEQIVAELKWTEKIIKDTLGVSPVYWRPPFGDVDNRVRAIASQLGFKTVIWTTGFDTQDWQIPGKVLTPEQVTANFTSWLTNKIPNMSTGFIVLEHDLYPEEVTEAITGILPAAQAAGLKMMPVTQCIGDTTPYKEQLAAVNNGTNTNSTNNGTSSPTTGPGKSSASKVSGIVGSMVAALAVAILHVTI